MIAMIANQKLEICVYKDYAVFKTHSMVYVFPKKKDCKYWKFQFIQ